MPKKHKAIAGVGASSIMELKAHLYKSQEESKKSKELAGPGVDFHRAKKKITPKNILSSHNSGVEARALKYVSDLFLYEFYILIFELDYANVCKDLVIWSLRSKSIKDCIGYVFLIGFLVRYNMRKELNHLM